MDGKVKLNAVLVGCGNIAGGYAKHIKTYDNVELRGCFDLNREAAEKLSAEFSGIVYDSLDSVLADPEVDIVVNLTIQKAHVEVVTACLKAGKHVHSEKPLAMTYKDAKALADLAEEQGVRLSSAPINYMGEAQQTAFKQIKDGKIGKVRGIYAEINHGRVERWHPNPKPFYEVGPLWDVGVYQLTLITAMFGPVKRIVNSFAKVIYPDRITKDGEPLHIETPEFYIVVLELANGIIVRLTVNFYVFGSKQNGSVEFLGDEGLLYLGSFMKFSADVECRLLGTEDFETIEPIRPYSVEGCEYGRGVEELADAIINDRPHRANGAHAAHVIETIEAIFKSAETEKSVEINSTFTPPAPMDWA